MMVNMYNLIQQVHYHDQSSSNLSAIYSPDSIPRWLQSSSYLISAFALGAAGRALAPFWKILMKGIRMMSTRMMIMKMVSMSRLYCLDSCVLVQLRGFFFTYWYFSLSAFSLVRRSDFFCLIYLYSLRMSSDSESFSSFGFLSLESFLDYWVLWGFDPFGGLSLQDERLCFFAYFSDFGGYLLFAILWSRRGLVTAISWAGSAYGLV